MRTWRSFARTHNCGRADCTVAYTLLGQESRWATPPRSQAPSASSARASTQTQSESGAPKTMREVRQNPVGVGRFWASAEVVSGHPRSQRRCKRARRHKARRPGAVRRTLREGAERRAAKCLPWQQAQWIACRVVRLRRVRTHTAVPPGTFPTRDGMSYAPGPTVRHAHGPRGPLRRVLERKAAEPIYACGEVTEIRASSVLGGRSRNSTSTSCRSRRHGPPRAILRRHAPSHPHPADCSGPPGGLHRTACLPLRSDAPDRS